MTTEVSQEAIDHCNKHKRCRKCPFMGGLCVAPVDGRKFSQWIEKMNQEINEYNKTNTTRNG